MIRVAGQPQMPPQMEEEMPQEPPMPEQEMPEQEPLMTADKQMIMEAMNLIQNALMILLEVCPPEQYENEGEEVPMEDIQMPEDEVPEEV